MKGYKQAASFLLIGITVGTFCGAVPLQHQVARSILGKWQLLRMRDMQPGQPGGKAESYGRFFTRGPGLEFLPNRAVDCLLTDSTRENLGAFAVDYDSILVLNSQDKKEERYTIVQRPLEDTLKLKGNKLVVWYLRMK